MTHLTQNGWTVTEDQPSLLLINSIMGGIRCPMLTIQRVLVKCNCVKEGKRFKP